MRAARQAEASASAGPGVFSGEVAVGGGGQSIWRVIGVFGWVLGGKVVVIVRRDEMGFPEEEVRIVVVMVVLWMVVGAAITEPTSESGSESGRKKGRMYGVLVDGFVVLVEVLMMVVVATAGAGKVDKMKPRMLMLMRVVMHTEKRVEGGLILLPKVTGWLGKRATMLEEGVALVKVPPVIRSVDN